MKAFEIYTYVNGRAIKANIVRAVDAFDAIIKHTGDAAITRSFDVADDVYAFGDELGTAYTVVDQE